MKNRKFFRMVMYFMILYLVIYSCRQSNTEKIKTKQVDSLATYAKQIAEESRIDSLHQIKEDSISHIKEKLRLDSIARITKAKDIYAVEISDFNCAVSGNIEFDANGNQTANVFILNLIVKNEPINIINQDIGKNGIGFIETKQLGKLKVKIVDPLATTQKVFLWKKN